VSRGRIALAALLLVAAACSDGSSSGTADTSAASSPEVSGAGVCYEARRAGDGGALAFSDATTERGLAESLAGMYGHATAVGDANGDGWPDLFVGSFDGVGADRLLLGGPDGFRPDNSFSLPPGRTSGAAFADLDDDDDLDLVLARNHRDNPSGRAPSVALRNTDGRLTVAGELDAQRGARSVGVLDYDDDGRLDVMLVEDRFSGGSSVLLHNDGDLRFSDATTTAGLPGNVHGLGIATADLSADGRPDVFVAGSNRLFVNEGGSFREVEGDFEWETFGDEDDVAGVAVGDVNRDGRPDLVVGQHYNSTVDRGTEVPIRLYLNQGTDDAGDPEFRDVTEEAGLVPLPTKAPHVEIVDLDADGRPDLLTTASADDGTRPAVFRNLGGEGVPRFEAPAGLGSDRYWIAGATFDADRDGRLDVFLVEFDRERTSVLLGNDSDTAHWLAVQTGPAGADSVGATVEVYRAGGLGDGSQLLGAREVTASTGFSSGSLPIAAFGLGDATDVDVRVQMADGDPVEVRAVATDRLINVGIRDPVCGL
jgi:enediyne biosynthesis protein E4